MPRLSVLLLLPPQEYDEFNEAVKRNIDSMVRQPLEEVSGGSMAGGRGEEESSNANWW